VFVAVGVAVGVVVLPLGVVVMMVAAGEEEEWPLAARCIAKAEAFERSPAEIACDK